MIIQEFTKGTARVAVFSDRGQMGRAAGRAIAEKIRDLQKGRAPLNLMFAAAPSQNEVLEQLCQEPGIRWEEINAFHMDEYAGLPAEHPSGFANFLRRRLFDRLPFGRVFCLDSTAADPEAEARRYAALLADYPLDICVLGIGENGHIAFNDPGAADFHDPLLVKVVTLDEACRSQQVHDGCFASLAEVPKTAVTVTIPGLMAAKHLFCSVPGKSKAQAVERLMTGDAAPDCPASILTQKDGVTIYLDADAASRIL